MKATSYSQNYSRFFNLLFKCIDLNICINQIFKQKFNGIFKYPQLFRWVIVIHSTLWLIWKIFEVILKLQLHPYPFR